jgi:hypothetical protein
LDGRGSAGGVWLDRALHAIQPHCAMVGCGVNRK